MLKNLNLPKVNFENDPKSAFLKFYPRECGFFSKIRVLKR